MAVTVPDLSSLMVCTSGVQAFSVFGTGVTLNSVYDSSEYIHPSCKHCGDTVRNPNSELCRQCKDKIRVGLLFCHTINGENIFSKHEEYVDAKREWIINNSDGASLDEITFTSETNSSFFGGTISGGTIGIMNGTTTDTRTWSTSDTCAVT
jgi:hypothetical protein